jgi:hypothetical protein
MISIKKLLIGLGVGFVFSAAHAAPMTVRAEKPDFVKLLNQNTAWNIFLDGDIDPATPKLVSDALARTGNDGADVYINSAGGNLLAGMKIGTLIRRAGANTYIGTLVPDPTFNFAGKTGVKAVPGGCYSACTLAFLGGVYRYSIRGSQFGVHRFYTQSSPTDQDLDTAQIISAAINTYIREMGVDPRLFDLMVDSGKDGIRLLNPTELTSLNVVNNGRRPPQWSIEVVDGGQYLRGVQDSVYGQGKAVFLCGKGQMLFQSFYQIGPEKAASVAAGGWYHSLLIDGKTFPLAAPEFAKASGNEISTIFSLSRAQALAVASARQFGHAMQLGRDAPTFVGYQIDIPSNSTAKVGTFIRNCFRS